MKTIEELEKQLKEIEGELYLLKQKDKKECFEIKNNYYLDEDLIPSRNTGDIFDFSLLEYFNMFETHTQAEKIGNKLNAYLKLWHIAQYLNEGWNPDWNNPEEVKYTIEFCHNLFEIDGYVWTKYFNLYFKSKELAEKAIEMMGEKSLKEYFS